MAKKRAVEPVKTTVAAANAEAHTTDAHGAQHPHDHEIHVVAEGSKVVLPLNHNVADKKLQKQLEEAEKEIAKKLAILKAENEGEDSQHSICIAPPPPANKMSTVGISYGLKSNYSLVP